MDGSYFPVVQESPFWHLDAGGWEPSTASTAEVGDHVCDVGFTPKNGPKSRKCGHPGRIQTEYEKPRQMAGLLDSEPRYGKLASEGFTARLRSCRFSWLPAGITTSPVTGEELVLQKRHRLVDGFRTVFDISEHISKAAFDVCEVILTHKHV